MKTFKIIILYLLITTGCNRLYESAEFHYREAVKYTIENADGSDGDIEEKMRECGFLSIKWEDEPGYFAKIKALIMYHIHN